MVTVANPAAPSCTGAIPANAQLCAGDDQGLDTATPRIIVPACTPSAFCEYVCNPSFIDTNGIVTDGCEATVCRPYLDRRCVGNQVEVCNPAGTGYDSYGDCSATGQTCSNGQCQAAPATCTDGIQNSGETGVDCGGATCPACPTATCGDGIQQAGETCDDGALNGQAGGCNSNCDGIVPTTSTCREGEPISGSCACNSPLSNELGVCKCSSLADGTERHLINGECKAVLGKIKRQLETAPTAISASDTGFFAKIANIFRALRCFFAGEVSTNPLCS